MHQASQGVFSELKNVIVWVKNNAGLGSFYRSQHELIFAYKNGTAPHINNFELGQNGRYRTNVWEFPGASSFKKDRIQELALHPTVKPVQMIADAIKDVSGRGDIVLDLFGGSGSTLIAAHKTGRRAYLCEIDPVYCDTIIARFEAFAHDDVELLGNILLASKGEEIDQ
jgi:DNA modification methylase